MVRLFVAIDLPALVAEQLHAICFGLPGARWVPLEQLHLTLRFIGEVDGGVFQEIREALAAVRSTPFTLQVKGLGVFPPRKPPRVLWAGVEPVAGVIGLRNRVERVLVRQGLEPEHRRFSPHITLARLQRTPASRLASFMAGNGLFSLPPFTVSAFHLYSSQLTPKGAIHHLEASYPLAAG